MFLIEENIVVNTDVPLIASNYRILLGDEDIPILFTGTNRYATRIIGSSVDENYKEGVERYFHVLVDKTEYLLFQSRKVTYYELLKRANPIWVVDKLIKEGTHRIAQLSFADIPNGYMPAQDTLCPITAFEPTYKYSTSLIGGLADANHAIPEDVSDTQNSIADAINSALNTLKRLVGIDHETYLEPATASSFRINYEVRLKSFPALFHSETEYLQYLNDFLGYCFDDLPADSNQLANLRIEGLEKFNSLMDKLYDLSSLGTPAVDTKDEIRDSLIQDLTTTSRALQTAARVVGKNYKSLAVMNVSANEEHPLGVINAEYQKDLKEAVSILNESTLVKKIEISDEGLKDYTVHIFEFNKNTGTGWGYLRDPEDETNQSTVRIAVTTGYQPISPSKYTRSLDQNQFIKVRGILKKTGKADKLEIQEEPTE